MIELKIITASTRAGRKGPAVTSWITEVVKRRQEFNIELFDLAKINLPFLDEPNHPRFRQYLHQHTKEWSKSIDSADAFIIVTAEYNYGVPAPIKNAIDFLFHEWHYKPVAFVSYGGLVGGTRAVQMLKQIVTAVKMMPMLESVNIPFFIKYIDEQGIFHPTEEMEKSAEAMLKELLVWANGLKAMRMSQKN